MKSGCLHTYGGLRGEAGVGAGLGCGWAGIGAGAGAAARRGRAGAGGACEGSLKQQQKRKMLFQFQAQLGGSNSGYAEQVRGGWSREPWRGPGQSTARAFSGRWGRSCCGPGKELRDRGKAETVPSRCSGRRALPLPAQVEQWRPR